MGRGAPDASPRGRIGVAGRVATVLGVLLVVAGLVVAGDVAWTTWLASPVTASQQERAASERSRGWASSRPAAPPVADAAPVVRREPHVGSDVAVLFVPRFGADWHRIVRQGVDEATILNSAEAGVGHYPGTAMPGGVGNFAVAAHDTGYGDAFRRVGALRVGDLVVAQTRDGWYTYRFRNLQWVQPSGVGVIAPVPDRPTRTPTARLITLTTCDPPYHAQEREIAYGSLVGFSATRPAGIG